MLRKMKTLYFLGWISKKFLATVVVVEMNLGRKQHTLSYNSKPAGYPMTRLERSEVKRERVIGE